MKFDHLQGGKLGDKISLSDYFYVQFKTLAYLFRTAPSKTLILTTSLVIRSFYEFVSLKYLKYLTNAAAMLFTRHRGIGGDGIVLIEKSSVANAKMRIFNRDGSEGLMSGNCIRCVAKYLFDKKIVKKDKMKIETASGVKSLKVYTYGNEVRSVSVEMGKASLVPRHTHMLQLCQRTDKE